MSTKTNIEKRDREKEKKGCQVQKNLKGQIWP